MIYMLEFYNTIAGKQFFDRNIPRIGKALELQNILKIYEMREELKLTEDEIEKLLKIIKENITEC